jgi:hypothetical protein
MNKRLLLSLTIFATSALIAVRAQVAPTSTTAAAASDPIQMSAFSVTEMKSFSDQAISGKTPVAFTEFGKEQITDELGSRDIPMLLNSSPSVYASTDSGGAGDARINVRGFDQRNISILINGVPTNDMENGWLYWSNWDGLGDVSAAVQMQRGLSAVTLPTPSIGGTMNIVTDPAASHRGASVKVEAGYDEFYKITGVYSTGLLKDKFALTLGAVAKTGDENNSVRGTWTTGAAYYVGGLYRINPTNRIEFFAIGAPQRHGQRRFASNIAACDADLTGAAARGPVNAGRDLNVNYAPVDPNYTGQQYWNRGLHSRYDSGFLNQYENYYHKPQINANWYSTINSQLKLATVFYFSGGYGGGSTTLNNGSGFSSLPNSDSTYGSANDWNAIIAANAGTRGVFGATKTAGQSLGILANSVNVQSEVGIVSKLTYKLSPALTLNAGVDWRTYQADHFNEVRDLLGGSYYIATTSQDSDFWTAGAAGTQLHLGDKVSYYYHSTVDWLGGFVQAQYDQGPINAFAVYGASGTDYGYTDQFHKNSAGGPVHLEADTFTGQQAKGGLRYTFTKGLSAFANAGWVTKAPIFTTAIDTFNSKLVSDAPTETFRSTDIGGRFESDDRKFNINASFYYTEWRNRSSVSSSATTTTYRRGVNADYSGFELEGAYQPNKWVRFDAAASFAKAIYTTNGTVQTINDAANTVTSAGTLYIKDLRVGDAPQTQYAYSVAVFPTKGLSVKLQGRSYERYWSDYDPVGRTVGTDLGQPWQIPNYSIYDLHVNYRLPTIADKYEISMFLHVFNLFDKTYVADSTDNSSFEGVAGAPSHSAQRAEVFLGAPRTVNLGVKFAF